MFSSDTARPCNKLLQGRTGYLPATDETYFATAWICCGVSLALKDGMRFLPFVTRWTTRLFGGFFWSRFGPTVPVEPASLSVWQFVQPALRKIVLPSVEVILPPPEHIGSAALPA